MVSSGLCEAANEAEGWVRLARYGDWPHPVGMQRFSRASAEEMARRFRGSVERVKRWLGLHRVPVYRGHPDDPVFANEEGSEDTSPYAWIVDLEAREDGLWGKRDWLAPANVRGALPAKFSPRWAMRPVGDGVYEPIKLISVGLTDTPNIPDGSNEQKDEARKKKEATMELLKKILKALGFSDAQSEAIAGGGEGAPTEEDILAKVMAAKAVEPDEEKLEAANTARQTAEQERDAARRDLDAARQDAQRHQTAFANERQARIGLILDDAVSNGRIVAADRPVWERRLRDASDFDGEVKELGKQTTAFANGRGTPKTAGLGKRDAAEADNSRKFRDAVEERMAKTNEPWHVAWANCKRDKKLAALLEGTAETGV